MVGSPLKGVAKLDKRNVGTANQIEMAGMFQAFQRTRLGIPFAAGEMQVCKTHHAGRITWLEDDIYHPKINIKGLIFTVSWGYLGCQIAPFRRIINLIPAPKSPTISG